jgi:hypothetical protein
MSRVGKRFHRGAATIEMAIVLPLLLLLILGVMEYGWMFLRQGSPTPGNARAVQVTDDKDRPSRCDRPWGRGGGCDDHESVGHKRARTWRHAR